MRPPLVAIVSFRLGGPDGVSVVAGHWRHFSMDALCERLAGLVAAAGWDRLLPGGG